jgi:site-specific DNA-methyltransferase (adenine-specific)
MVRKSLKKMECSLGFVQIPSSYRSELIGNAQLPCSTKVNGCEARLDKFGRLWSSTLRSRFTLGTIVELKKTDAGYDVFPAEAAETESSPISPTIDQKNKAEIVVSDIGEDLKAVALEPYFHANSIYIFNDSILETEAIAESSIDLTVTSPPYGVDIKYENYDDSIPYNDYLNFAREWLQRCFDFTKDDGRLCLNIPLDKNKGGQQSVAADITCIAKEIGWKYHSTIIWNEQNISRRTAWGSWLSASAPFVIAPVEVIIVLYKKMWKKTHKGKSDLVRKDFIEWTNGVWNFSGESRNRIGHPAPFPVELPRRCIKLFSYVGDTVLDPFLGSGTTLLACLETERVGVGVEINKNYCDIAIKRLKEYGVEQKKLITRGLANE